MAATFSFSLYTWNFLAYCTVGRKITGEPYSTIYNSFLVDLWEPSTTHKKGFVRPATCLRMECGWSAWSGVLLASAAAAATPSSPLHPPAFPSGGACWAIIGSAAFSSQLPVAELSSSPSPPPRRLVVFFSLPLLALRFLPSGIIQAESNSKDDIRDLRLESRAKKNIEEKKSNVVLRRRHLTLFLV